MIRSLALVCLVSSIVGCMSTVSYRFSGQQMPTPGSTPGKLIVEGHSEGTIKGTLIHLTFSHRGDESIRFSYINDTYVARSTDGRAIVLEKDFISYPSALDSGKMATVTLKLPSDLKAGSVSHIIATIDNQRRVVQIQPLHEAPRSAAPLVAAPPLAPTPTPIAAAAEPTTIGGKIASKVDAGYAYIKGKVTGEDPLETIAAPAPIAPDPALAGTIPVTVEFSQEIGGMLHAVVAWNADQPGYRLAAGERETFHLEPGRHELKFECAQPPSAPTVGRLSVTAQIGAPMRVELKARARSQGAEVEAHVWHGKQMVLKQSFEPGGRF